MEHAFKILGYLTTEEGCVCVCEDIFSPTRIHHTTLPPEGCNYFIKNTHDGTFRGCMNYDDSLPVLPGIHYTNLKNNNNYKVIGVGTNTTNKDDGITMVSYIPEGGDPMEPYLRTLDEFRTKFCVTLYPPMHIKAIASYNPTKAKYNELLAQGYAIYDSQLVPHHYFYGPITTPYGCKYDTQGDK